MTHDELVEAMETLFNWSREPRAASTYVQDYVYLAFVYAKDFNMKAARRSIATLRSSLRVGLPVVDKGYEIAVMAVELFDAK